MTRQPGGRGKAGTASNTTASPRAVAGLIARLDDPADEVRSAARLRFEALGRAAAAPFFAGYDGYSPGQRLEALDLLGGAGRAPAVARRAAKRFDVERDARLRASLVTLIGRVGGAADIPALARALLDADKRVRANAVEALSQIGGRQIIRLLVPLLSDPNNRVRANTARALWEFDDMRGIVRRAFEGMLADDSKWMRASAFYTFGEIGAMDFFQRLVDSIDEEDEDIARNAVVALVGYAEKHDPTRNAPPPAKPAKPVPEAARRATKRRKSAR